MGMPKLLKSVEKVDDYTVKITLNQPEAPFLSDLAMEFAGIQSKEYADAMLKAGTPEKIDQEPIGTGPFDAGAVSEGRHHPLQGVPEFWGGKAKIDDLVFAITPDASVRWAKLQKDECQVMPYPNPADSTRSRKIRTSRCWNSPASTSAISPPTRRRSPSTTCACARRINMAINKKAIIDAVYPVDRHHGEEPDPADSMWSYNNDVKDDPYDPAAAKKLLAEAGYPNGFETDLWAMPVQRPYNPNAKRIAELMQADLAKIGVKAEIKTYRMGRIPQARAGRRAPDGAARLDRRQRRPGQLPQHAARLRLGQDGNGSNIAKFCYQPFDDLVQKAKTRQRHRPSAPSSTNRRRSSSSNRRRGSPSRMRCSSSRCARRVIGFKLSPFGRHTFYGVDMRNSATRRSGPQRRSRFPFRRDADGFLVHTRQPHGSDLHRDHAARVRSDPPHPRRSRSRPWRASTASIRRVHEQLRTNTASIGRSRPIRRFIFRGSRTAISAARSSPTSR